MAKLTGVRTLGMKNGEITRVEYEGVAYERLEGDAKKGDLALRDTKAYTDDITIYSYYKVIRFDKSDMTVRIIDNTRRASWYDFGSFEYFRKASEIKPSIDARLTDVEARVEKLEGEITSDFNPCDYVRHRREPALKVGDYAKVVPHNNTNFFGGRPGDIVKIVRVSDRYTTEELDGGNFGQNPKALREALVKATDVEVAEAKAKVAEAAKWAKLGRKVNEFRKGDIVLNRGGVYEVESQGSPHGRCDVLLSNHLYRYPSSLALITPVEARFDRA